jgi:hypothetical protein
MPTKNADILKNVTISSPATSPVLTISGSVTTVSYNLSIVCPLDTSATLTLLFERSTDGNNWDVFDQTELFGGPILKGTNAGSQATQLVNGEIDNLNVGDKLRVVASVVTGSWTISASITQS